MQNVHQQVQSYPSVWWQCECPHSGFQLLLSSRRVAAVAVGDWSDLDVELLGFVVVEVRVAGVKVVLLLLRAACRRGSRRKAADLQLPDDVLPSSLF